MKAGPSVNHNDSKTTNSVSNLIPRDTVSNLHFYISSCWKGLHHLSKYKFKQNYSCINGKDNILLLIMNICVGFQ